MMRSSVTWDIFNHQRLLLYSCWLPYWVVRMNASRRVVHNLLNRFVGRQYLLVVPVLLCRRRCRIVDSFTSRSMSICHLFARAFPAAMVAPTVGPTSGLLKTSLVPQQIKYRPFFTSSPLVVCNTRYEFQFQITFSMKYTVPVLYIGPTWLVKGCVYSMTFL